MSALCIGVGRTKVEGFRGRSDEENVLPERDINKE